MAKKQKTSGASADGAAGGAAGGGAPAAAADLDGGGAAAESATLSTTAGCQRCIADGVDPVASNPHFGSDDTSGSRQKLTVCC